MLSLLPCPQALHSAESAWPTSLWVFLLLGPRKGCHFSPGLPPYGASSLQLLSWEGLIRWLLPRMVSPCPPHPSSHPFQIPSVDLNPLLKGPQALEHSRITWVLVKHADSCYLPQALTRYKWMEALHIQSDIYLERINIPTQLWKFAQDRAF